MEVASEGVTFLSLLGYLLSGKELQGEHKEGNSHDLCAVALLDETGAIVGHVPRKISAACSTAYKSELVIRGFNFGGTHTNPPI